MALIGNCKKFVAHSIVENILTTIWYGQSSFENSFKENLKVIFYSFTSTRVFEICLFL